MNRILRGKPATLTFTYLDQNGAAAAPDGTVTVGIAREDGSTLVAAGATTTVSNNLRTYTLTAAQTARLDVLEATWTNGTWTETTRHEVVGGFYVTVNEVEYQRNIETNSSKFPPDAIVEARDWFEDLCEAHVGIAFVPRYQRDTFKGDSTGTAYLSKLFPRSLIAVTESGTALTSSDWEDWQVYDTGRLVRATDVFDPPDSTVAESNISIAYEHGLDSPPSDLRAAALTAIRSKLLADRQGVPSRELSITNELGIVRIAQPTPEFPTGIPTVDAVLNRYRDLYRVPAIA